MNKYIIPTALFLFCMFSIAYTTIGMERDYKVDICNTPIYHHTINQLNKAVKTCK